MNNISDIELSIVLPCRNEGGVLRKNLEYVMGLLNYMNCNYEIIVVDDGSRDGTRDTIDGFISGNPNVKCLKIYHSVPQGQGKSVADGVHASQGKIVGIIEPDFNIHARYIPAFYQAVKQGADAAIARRYYRVSLLTLHRYLLNVGYRFIARAALKVNVHDMEAGFKFFKRGKFIQALEHCSDQQWFWNTEIMAWSSVKGYKIEEIPCLYLRNVMIGLSAKPLSNSFTYFFKLLRLRKIMKRHIEGQGMFTF
ncbi:MAG: glycosyltransferase family 2 protein [bacterium]